MPDVTGPVETGGTALGCGPNPPKPPAFGAGGAGAVAGAAETGGVAPDLDGCGPADGAPGFSAGALEMVPSPAGLVARSKEPFDIPGALNLLLRSVD